MGDQKLLIPTSTLSLAALLPHLSWVLVSQNHSLVQRKGFLKQDLCRLQVLRCHLFRQVRKCEHQRRPPNSNAWNAALILNLALIRGCINKLPSLSKASKAP